MKAAFGIPPVAERQAVKALVKIIERRVGDSVPCIEPWQAKSTWRPVSL